MAQCKRLTYIPGGINWHEGAEETEKREMVYIPNPASKQPTMILMGTPLLHFSLPPAHQRKVSIIPLYFPLSISLSISLFITIDSVDDT
jgi:hypothetical protein